MKIAIVIHTNTGNTLKFAQAIRDALTAKGHEVDLLGLRTIGAVSPMATLFGGSRFSIKSPPELDEFDAVLAGGPVWMFKASPVIMKFLVEDVRKLKGKKALSFVTMGSPLKLTGGDRALRMMNDELEVSGADVLEGEKLVCLFKANKEKLAAAVERICERLIKVK